MKSIVGQKYKNKRGQEFIVLSQIKYQKYRIRFINTGFEKDVSYSNIREKSIIDKLEPSVYDIGILGYVDKQVNRIAYDKWRTMISRCYNTKDKKYKRYGGNGVTVCERWHRFDYFLEDVTTLDGYNEELFNNGALQLDKDIKQFDNNKKIYSKDTCCLVTAKNNCQYRKYSIQKEFIAISPMGDIHSSKNIKQFCRDFNLTATHVSRCLRNLDKQHKGWKFYYKNIEEEK